MNSPAITVRALIVDQNELLMVKHRPNATYHALPGGHLELGETLQAGLARELMEETGVQADVGQLLFVNQWINHSSHRVEFFFWIKNARDFRHLDTKTATHGHEIESYLFDNAADPGLRLLPAFLQTKFSEIVKFGESYPTEIIVSS